MIRIHSRSDRTWGVLAAALLAGVVLGSVSSPARAGQLDVALLGRGADNVLFILHKNKKDKKYNNVGVLPFEVVKGCKDKGYENAPLRLDLAARLEPARSRGQDPKGEVIGIISDATSTASGKALRAYQADKCSKKDFDELFDATYLRAWGEKGGTKEVSADAFLTGRVVNPHPKDPAKVQIIIELIDRDSYDAKDEGVKREKIF